MPMTFRQLWSFIGKSTFCVEEYCRDKFIMGHTSMGYSTLEGETQYFCLWGNGMDYDETFIDSEQEIGIDDAGDVLVVDQDGNRLTLRFLESKQINIKDLLGAPI